MKRLDSKIFWGLLLILMGILFMLANMDFISLTVVGPLLFGAIGLLFVIFFMLRKDNWWAAIPGLALLSLALVSGAEWVLPVSLESWSGAIFLGGLALGFFAVYARTLAEQWWALIPAGTLTTFSAIIVMETLQILQGEALGGVFLLGMGLTFALVYISPSPTERQKWAAIPAAILAAMGVLGIVALTDLLAYVWPVALILLGLYILLRRPRNRG